MLVLQNVHTFYGKDHVLRDISFVARPGEVTAVLGRNGAGKTTLLRTIMGLTPAHSGRIVFDGTELTKLASYQIPRLGIGYVPQGRGTFPDLTVAEDIKVGLVATGRPALIPKPVLEVFPVLAERLGQATRTLSGGEQQMLTVARALALNPRLLIMDEPTEGLMPALVGKVQEVVRDMAAKGAAVLLAEQRLDVALTLAHRVLVLDTGRVRYAATPAEIAAQPDELLRFLGVRATTQAR